MVLGQRLGDASLGLDGLDSLLLVGLVGLSGGDSDGLSVGVELLHSLVVFKGVLLLLFV